MLFISTGLRDKQGIIRTLSLVGLLLLGFVARAQNVDIPTRAAINVDVPVTDTITDGAPFDIWEFSPLAGEQYRAVMQASEGLAPLIGLQDGSGDIVVASDRFDDGTSRDALPNETVTILFEIPSDGSYALVATRIGTDNGTTAGGYTLTLSLLASAPEPDDSYVDVIFRCGEVNATTALVMTFGDQSEENFEYSVTAYGFDGFDPVIRLGGDDGSVGVPCELASPMDEELTLEFDLGNGDVPVTFGATDITGISVYTITLDEPGPVRVTLGSRSGESGRYALQISGLSIETTGDSDVFMLRNGPFARSEPIVLWMLREGLSRLDPFLVAPDRTLNCPDLGLRTCPAELQSSSIRLLRDGSERHSSNRLDAVVRIETGTTDPVEIAAASQNVRTTGAYILWLFGTLPAVR